MKPESNIPNLETIEIAQKDDVFKPEIAPSELEVSPISISAERFEQKADLSAIRSDIGLTSIIPTPVATNDDVNTTTTQDASFVNPIIAADDDLIEKEWVDKAKKIVADTRDDPYLREKEVSKLQVDYIKKRFGRELGVVD